MVVVVEPWVLRQVVLVITTVLLAVAEQQIIKPICQAVTQVPTLVVVVVVAHITMPIIRAVMVDQGSPC